MPVAVQFAEAYLSGGLTKNYLSKTLVLIQI